MNTLLVLSASSGVGKTTVAKRFIQKNRNWNRVITCTTRRPRKNEKDGIDYRFLTESSFDLLVKSDKFLEYAVVHGQFYGTLMSDVESIWDAGQKAFLVIDTKGKEIVKAKLPNALTIFLMPPSKDEMERRLRKRGSDSEEVIQIRLNRALLETKDSITYDYILINNDVDEVVRKITEIISNLG